MQTVLLGGSDLSISQFCLGTMTFGEQVNEVDAFAILDYAVERGINFLDTAEMYSVPQREQTFGITEEIIGRWFKADPIKRQKMQVATKITGPARGMPWIRNGTPQLKAQDFEEACNDSLRRLQTDVIDLYQIHWPMRSVPIFGEIYFDPQKDDQDLLSVHEQLQALDKLIKAGKVRTIGLCNETSFGLHEFTRVAQQYDLPRIMSVQNPYCLINRSVENSLDETLHRLQVSLLAYSPLAYGLLTGKYDKLGFTGAHATSEARMTKFNSMRRQRWGRESALKAARLYNELAKENHLTPAQMALAFCLNKWQVTSTIIGVTSITQLSENLSALNIKISKELMDKIDEIRLAHRDPAQ